MEAWIQLPSRKNQVKLKGFFFNINTGIVTQVTSVKQCDSEEQANEILDNFEKITNLFRLEVNGCEEAETQTKNPEDTEA